MIDKTTDFLEKGRINFAVNNELRGELYGSFILPGPTKDEPCLRVVVGAGAESDWQAMGLPLPAFEHASVSVVGEERCPTWAEMCYIKDLFWGPEECVIQYHPPRSQYVNNHPYVLHLWKPKGVAIPLPPRVCV